jgi:hypothetical protein
MVMKVIIRTLGKKIPEVMVLSSTSTQPFKSIPRIQISSNRKFRKLPNEKQCPL